MRVIAGKYRSRVLQGPPGLDTRPTSDRLRETLFNILAPRMEGARFVDLYAGAGGVGIEAISRGAAHVWFAESSPAALAALRRNLSALKISAGYTLEDRNAARLLHHLAKAERAADIVFLDPPYEAAEEYSNTLHILARDHGALLRPGALVIAEHRKKLPLPESYGALRRVRLLKQGDSTLSFYGVSTPKLAEADDRLVNPPPS